VALVDFLPMVGGALAGIPTVLFALGHSLTAGIVTAAVFIAYQQAENHLLNPVIMSRTVKVNPLLILVSVLIGTSIGDWVGGVGHRLTTQPGRSSGRFAARWPCSRPVDWPTSMRYPSGSRM
jgi:hypothetical protein